MNRAKTGLVISLVVLSFVLSCGKEGRKSISLPTPPWKEATEGGRKEFRYLSATLSRVRAYFYDPESIDVKEMLREGLDRLQSTVASVMVRWREGALQIQVDRAQQSFDVSRLKDIGDLIDVSRKILGFVLDELEKQKADQEEVEDAFYSFVNGMLYALDPYSMLIRPKYMDDLTMQTRGEYGGVGMVLSIRDWELTVIAPMPGTPASEAGIKKGDKILQIDDQSTVNMPLTDAVDMIRGPAGTKVRLLIRRKGWDKPREFVLTRRKIKLKSVSGRLLEGNIAYLRINHFIGGTSRDLRAKWEELKKEAGGNIRGVILDLWANPGGLLQEAIQVADYFLESGMIVATVGAPGTLRREWDAHKQGTIAAKIPMVVLVSPTSASASEIVAGSLKNLDRALLLGQTTFGKGTVQQIYPARSRGEPSLKLTIKEYLTAGNVSIQSVGVVPHVRVVPIGVFDHDSQVFWPDEPRKAEDRKRRRHSRFQRPPERPAMEIRYWKNKLEDREYTGTVDETGAEPELVELAREVLDRYGRARASETLQAARSFLASRAASEERKMVAQLRRYGVDFSGTFDATPSGLDVNVEVCTLDATAQPRKGDGKILVRPGVKGVRCGGLEVIPGRRHSIVVTVRSASSTGPLYAIIRSPFDYLDSMEFVFGRVAKAGSKSWFTPFRLAEYIPAGVEPFTVEVYGKGHRKVGEFGPFTLKIASIPTPRFTLGVSEKGDNKERRVELTFKNVGRALSKEVVVLLRNKSGGAIFIDKGRAILKNVAPGQEGRAVLSYKIRALRPTLTLEAAVFDYTYRKGLTKRYRVPLQGTLEVVAPTITFVKRPELMTSRDEVSLEVRVSHPRAIRDVYVTVTNEKKEIYDRKVFYRVVGAPSGTFTIRVPVWKGVNKIGVTARRDRELMGYETVYVVKE